MHWTEIVPGARMTWVIDGKSYTGIVKSVEPYDDDAVEVVMIKDDGRECVIDHDDLEGVDL